jgi:hypothetical protein
MATECQGHQDRQAKREGHRKDRDQDAPIKWIIIHKHFNPAIREALRSVEIVDQKGKPQDDHTTLSNAAILRRVE